jgi:murein L,D-transpeptidase YcbB/YkuD
MTLLSADWKRALRSTAVVTLFCITPFAPAWADVQAHIFDIFDSLHQGEQPYGITGGLYAADTLNLLYSERGYEPAWASYDAITPVLAELSASRDEGLDPEDYHYSVLKSLESEYVSAADQGRRDHLRATFDVLLSDAVLLYGRHLQEGKVDPGRVEPTWNFSRPDFDPETTVKRVQEALAEGNVVERLEAFKPKMRVYGLLKSELARYRELDTRYDFTAVPMDTVLRPGMRHDNVIALRTQLARLGYQADATDDGALYDDELAASVRDFQRMHTLDPDGIVGKGTFRELNTPYADRVDQLRLNLDRLRWIRNDVTDQMVIVNIPGFELYYIRDNNLDWETGVMVGKIKHQTPIFRHEITYLEFNPTWTVPRSIIRRSLFPKFNANPDYLRSANYKLYNTDGVEVDPFTLDWSQYSANRFPFRVVQQPGPDNALGRVKFMFPNEYAIYLHDTPARSLFSRSSRAFSSGCIRVQDPMQLAERLLADEQGWDRSRIDATVEDGNRRVVRLGSPVEVMLMYWTASPTPDDRIQLHPDIYDRDARTLALLDEHPRGIAQ